MKNLFNKILFALAIIALAVGIFATIKAIQLQRDMKAFDVEINSLKQ